MTPIVIVWGFGRVRFGQTEEIYMKRTGTQSIRMSVSQDFEKNDNGILTFLLDILYLVSAIFNFLNIRKRIYGFRKN